MVDSAKSPFDQGDIVALEEDDKQLLVLSIDGIRVSIDWFVSRPRFDPRSWVLIPLSRRPLCFSLVRNQDRLAGTSSSLVRL